MIITSWADVVAGSLTNLWFGVLSFLPSIIGALVVLLIGLIVATGLGKLVEKVLAMLRLDSGLAALGLEPYFKRAGLELRGAHFCGKVVQWFLVIVFALAASDILRLYALTTFLRDVLAYVPNVVLAVLILVAALALANVLRRLVTASVMSARLHAGNFLGLLVWWVVVIFGIFGALEQLRVAPGLVQTIVTGIIAMLALAGGLAFGLGGRDYAAHLIKRLQERTER